MCSQGTVLFSNIVSKVYARPTGTGIKDQLESKNQADLACPKRPDTV
jgi:hypothetical protein